LVSTRPVSDPVNTVSGFTNIGGLPIGTAHGNLMATYDTAFTAAMFDRPLQRQSRASDVDGSKIRGHQRSQRLTYRP